MIVLHFEWRIIESQWLIFTRSLLRYTHPFSELLLLGIWKWLEIDLAGRLFFRVIGSCNRRLRSIQTWTLFLLGDIWTVIRVVKRSLVFINFKELVDFTFFHGYCRVNITLNKIWALFLICFYSGGCPLIGWIHSGFLGPFSWTRLVPGNRLRIFRLDLKIWTRLVDVLTVLVISIMRNIWAQRHDLILPLITLDLLAKVLQEWLTLGLI